MSKAQSPLARTAGLDSVGFPEETVVYDRQTDKAHCLNQTAALVWKHCDGTSTPKDIARSLETRLGAPVPQDLVTLALSELSKAGLLEPVDTGRRAERGLSRREVIRRTAGMTTIALPLISTILAPTPANAATLNCNCVMPGDCLIKTGCPSTVNCNPSGMCAP